LFSPRVEIRNLGLAGWGLVQQGCHDSAQLDGGRASDDSAERGYWSGARALGSSDA